ncbi:MAG TPA: PAS domain S-box protein [Gemmatimonadales bacterium]
MAQRREDPTGSRPGRQRGMLAHPSAEPGAADTLHRHAELLQSSSDAIFTTTPEGAIVSCNPAAERLYGHRATAVIGQPFELLAPPERAAELARLLDGLRRGGRPDPVEYVVTRPDGRAVGISLSLSPIPNSRGGLAGVLAISRDITAHTRAEEQLRKVLSQLAQAESLARLGSWEWDLRSDTVAWSAELYRLCGVEPEHLRATLEGALEFVHPDDRAFVREVIARARRDGVPYVCEHRIVRPDGAVRSFQSRGTVVVDDLGQPVKLVGTGQDITERKQAEDALARYAALIESSEDALVTQSLEGRILTWNPGAERLYGHRGEEVAGRLLAIVEPPERAGELEGLLARVQRGEHIEHHETVRMRKDGARIAVSVSISPIKDGEGRIIGASSIARDITDSARAGEALARSRAQLRDFAGQLHSARETERTQIAREIQDELGQALTALKMDLFSLKHTVPAPLRDPLLVKTDEMAKLIDEMVDKVRTLATELRPAGLDSLGRDGAAGYLSKDRSPQELIAAVRRIVQGGMYVSPTLTEQLAAALDAGRAPIPHEALSDRENEVLRLIGAGKAVREIAAVLSLSPKTVSTYRTRILEKLGLRTSAELIRYALQHQLMP